MRTEIAQSLINFLVVVGWCQALLYKFNDKIIVIIRD